MADIYFSARAHTKILLHAVKYPHCAINGLLLGKIKNKSDDKSFDLQIVDAIPLFHICLHVSPMAEIALTMIDQFAARNNLVIAGYYLANENINDLSSEKPVHRTISDKIVENFNQALLVVVSNREVTCEMNENPLRISQYTDGKWRLKDRSSVHFEGDKMIQNTFAYMIKEEDYKDLVDFDNHLDNISLDWRNIELNRRIDEFMEEDR